jgi:hypothetical protein
MTNPKNQQFNGFRDQFNRFRRRRRIDLNQEIG